MACGLDAGTNRLVGRRASVRTLGNSHWHQPLYVMFDSEVFTDWFGLPHENTLPAHYDVDYLRVWRAPGTDL